MTLLLLIAYGWTLTTRNPFDKELLYIVGSMVFAFHFIIAAVTIVDVEEKHKYHDYGGF